MIWRGLKKRFIAKRVCQLLSELQKIPESIKGRRGAAVVRSD